MRNVSDGVVEKIITYIYYQKRFPKILPFMRNVEKYHRAGWATDDDKARLMCITWWITKATDLYSE